MSNSPSNNLGGLGGSNQAAPSGRTSCKKHWVAARVRYKDTKKNVPAVDAEITQGATTVDDGPLADGILKVTGLDAGAYEFSLPDVHPDEWAAE